MVPGPASSGTRSVLPGIGHPFHKPIDPRTPRLIAIAAETGFDGPYVHLIQKVAAEAGRTRKRDLPANATGMLGALCCEVGFDWRICRGLGVMARAVGLVGTSLRRAATPSPPTFGCGPRRRRRATCVR